MLIIDGDYPMAVGALDMDRDLTGPIDEVRAATGGFKRYRQWSDTETMASLPEMRKGNIAAALVKVVACVLKPGHPHGEFRTADIAHAAARGQLAYYQLLEAKGEARLLTNSDDFTEHIQTWSEADGSTDLPVGMVIGMEGADAIGWPQQVRYWWDAGVRVISLSHYGVSYYSHGTGTGTDGGLQPGADELLKEMDDLGMVLDVSHTSDESVRQELEIFTGPVLASHQNCRALVPGERQFPDEQLKWVIDRGGVIGASMDTWMLNSTHQLDWGGDIPPRRTVFARESITLEDYVDHIDRVCQLAGNSLHAAIGGDTDGQGGREGAPYEIDTVADYPKVANILDKRGYSREDVENVMYRNWQRFFEKWLPEKT